MVDGQPANLTWAESNTVTTGKPLMEPREYDPATAVYLSKIPRPNLLMMGIGHSGTSIATKMLNAMGWNLPEPRGDGGRAGESEAARAHDMRYCRQLANGKSPVFNEQLAMKVVSELKEPYVFKHPRFVITLQLWAPFLPQDALLIWVTRNLVDTQESHTRRGHMRDDSSLHPAATVKGHFEYAKNTYAWWPGPKVVIRYEDLVRAVSLFRRPEK